MREKFIEDMQVLSEKEIYRKYLLGSDIWYFKEYLGNSNYSSIYDEFKHFVSDKLDIQFGNIAIVGSAKTGFSLAPTKFGNQFSDESDFDLILVSPILYRKFWDAYFDLHFQGTYIKNYQFKTSEIFRRFISIKEPDPLHPILREWIQQVENFTKDYQVKFDIYNVINYRIYESWESVEKYHLKGIKELYTKFKQ